MATALGKELRKFRIDTGKNMTQMAKDLSVSTSMLSSIESGERTVSDSFIYSLVKTFPDHFSKRSAELLAMAAVSNKQFVLKMREGSEIDKDLVFAMARKFESMDDGFKNELISFLNK